MNRPFKILLAVLLTAGLLPAQDMLGIDATGNVYTLDSATGNGSLLGPLGYTGAVGLARNSADELYTICDNPSGGQALVQVDQLTGAGTFVTGVTTINPGLTFRGLSFDAADVLYAEHTTSYIVTVDMTTGVSALVNKPSAFDMRSIVFLNGDLYGWDLIMGLVQFDIVGTNWATNINPAAPGSAVINSMAVSDSGQIFGAGDDLYTIGDTDGITTLVGSGAYSGLTALEFLGVPPSPVYSVTNLVAGQVATFSFTDAVPGTTVILAYSVTGAGPTMSAFGLVDMSPPISTFPALVADASGSGGFSTGIPPGAAGRTLYTQGVDLNNGLLSNSLAVPVL
ncbi:MAG: hypothetical protein ACYSU1_03020 [Planctomycetota bacterium]|jgi:hypothetical protein